MRTLGIGALALLAAAPLAAQTIIYPPPGATVFSAPRVLPVRRPPAVRLAVGAVVAEQRIALGQERYRSDRRIRHPGLEIDLPAGSRFMLWRGNGPDRYCQQQYPFQMYYPPVDENGVAYQHVCAVDRDGDARFETLRLVPMARELPWRDLPIAPVRFVPDRGPPDPRLPPYRFALRLRVAAVSATSASIVAEYRMSSGDTDWGYGTAPGSSPLVLPLRMGASGRLAGLALRVGGTPARRTLSASGVFAPWLRLAPDRAGFVAGPHRVPRER